MVVHLTEVMPEEVRTSGFSMAYSLATIFGGMTPAISTALIEQTGNGAMPGAWMAFAAAVALVAVLPTARVSVRPSAAVAGVAPPVAPA